MSSLDQSTIWEGLACREDLTSLTRAVLHPCEFQVGLKHLIDSLYREHSKVIEVGCFTGITSLLIDDRFDKTLLDLNEPALELSEELFRHFRKKGTFIAGDMFRLPFTDDSFDVVFNSGVLEHFDYNERVAALKECGRILKPAGTMIVAFPNHYSVPYSIGYRYLNFVKQWPYPQEFKLYDVRKEIEEAGLTLIERRVLDNKTPQDYARRVRLFGLPLKYLFRIIGFEGYLTTIIARKG
jgi:ubiquinone/menaquinone biosynthesis C-methylase UbiE